ncbi:MULTISPECIES: BRO-N domain-containing protein [Pseudomonas]|jgi:prophage antirepressor-like protein|uniref:BRO-N domain-containing protein n=1 Tax=Pseudomonas TaxID=286 RepID=UPI00071891C3|nr:MULTISPECIES: BRO family protein [Pseudomonas]KSW25618.1 phage antirepressor [Pseudomonas sp. ADP]KRV73916.1 phage antirepressor [Pseudomonas citronellolis]KRW78643.1 phage antirepressor [Pseudomonas citronellolis]OBP12200.1 phage antirepressor [Pseudomonas sp. EGD-AKN5]QOF82207.1 phage antirepressor [Pseudomonas sp. ADPe]
MHDAYTPTTFIRHGRPLRGVMIDNQPWFAAQDLARLLGFGYPQRFHHRFRPHETRRIHVRYATDSEEPLDMINEAGLYKALIRFGHPESQHLDQWLSREVIPTLRDQHTPDHHTPRRVLMSWQARRVMLLDWQGELWVPLEEMPRLMLDR